MSSLFMEKEEQVREDLAQIRADEAVDRAGFDSGVFRIRRKIEKVLQEARSSIDSRQRTV